MRFAVDMKRGAKVLAVMLALAAAMAFGTHLLPARAAPDVGDGLTRLAGTLGAVHYLRSLCRPSENQQWRNKMLGLLATGGMSQSRKDQLINAFNAGYSRQQKAHRACTPAAANLGNTFVRQGANDARAIAGRL